MLTLTLSEATYDDLDQVQELVSKVDSPFLVLPSRTKQMESIELGLSLVLRDEDSKIVASASVTRTGEHSYWELSNCVAAEDWRGFGFQEILVIFRAAAIVASVESTPHVVAAIMPRNHRSIRHLLRLGFERTDIDWECGDCQNKSSLPRERRCCCDSFQISADGLAVLCGQFLAMTEDGGAILRSNGNEEVTIAVGSLYALGTRQRERIREFVQTWLT
jgi:N-acetylglutamate synthase-like GNAT family acetyltransferase